MKEKSFNLAIWLLVFDFDVLKKLLFKTNNRIKRMCNPNSFSSLDAESAIVENGRTKGYMRIDVRTMHI